MQHSLGPQVWGVPVLALIGYVLALVFTLRLVRTPAEQQAAPARHSNTLGTVRA